MGLFRQYGDDQKYKSVLRNGAMAAILLFLAVLTLFPIYYMVISSFGTPNEIGAASYTLFPKFVTLDSYKFFFWIQQKLVPLDRKFYDRRGCRHIKQCGLCRDGWVCICKSKVSGK